MNADFIWGSLFSGCGGSTWGALKAGFQPLFGVEINPLYAQLYKQNCGHVVVGDIANLKVDDCHFPTYLERKKNNQILTLQISPPCQDFSIVNASKKINPQRANLVTKTHQLIQSILPEYLVLENVKKYARSTAFYNYEAFLSSSGYKIYKSLIDFADMGLPQNRIRLISLAVSKNMPTPEISLDYKSNHRGWYEGLGGKVEKFPKVDLTGREYLALIDAKPGVPLLIERTCHQFNKIKVRYAHQPCWTLTRSIGTSRRTKVIDAVVNGQAYSLNVPALAKLQGFDDEYNWDGVHPSIAIQAIGNSLPPIGMQKFCEAIVEVNCGYKADSKRTKETISSISA